MKFTSSLFGYISNGFYISQYITNIIIDKKISRVFNIRAGLTENSFIDNNRKFYYSTFYII